MNETIPHEPPRPPIVLPPVKPTLIRRVQAYARCATLRIADFLSRVPFR